MVRCPSAAAVVAKMSISNDNVFFIGCPSSTSQKKVRVCKEIEIKEKKQILRKANPTQE